MSPNGGQINRRDAIRKFAGGLLVFPNSPTIQLEQESDGETIDVPAGPEYETEIRFLEKLPGITIQKLEEKYLVHIDRARFESPTAAERRQARSDIKKSVGGRAGHVGKLAPPPETTTTPEEPPELPLRRRKIFSDMSMGDSTYKENGDILAIGGANYDLERNRMTCSALAAMGAGNRSHISRLGVTFSVDAEESKAVMITATGKYRGLLTAAGSASSKLILTLNVVNKSTGTQLATEIATATGNVRDWKGENATFQRGIQATLQPNTEYTAFVELESYVDCYGVGEAGSDFGPQDNDRAEPPHGVKVDSLRIIP